MPKFPSCYSLFPWECCGEELGCGMLLAGLADSTAFPFDITCTSWHSSHSVLTAGSRQSCRGCAWGTGAECSQGGSVTWQQGLATRIQACQLLCHSHGSHFLPSLVTASWLCPPYLMRKPRSSFPKASSRRTFRQARSTCVTPRSRSERACPSVPGSCLPDTARSAAS